MAMLKFTERDGSPVYINHRAVVLLKANDGGTTILLTDGRETTVRESLDKVVSAIDREAE